MSFYATIAEQMAEYWQVTLREEQSKRLARSLKNFMEEWMAEEARDAAQDDER